MTLRDLTKELYEHMHSDPYNAMNDYFPAWEDLPESARLEWDKEIHKIRDAVID